MYRIEGDLEKHLKTHEEQGVSFFTEPKPISNLKEMRKEPSGLMIDQTEMEKEPEQVADHTEMKKEPELMSDQAEVKKEPQPITHHTEMLLPSDEGIFPDP